MHCRLEKYNIIRKLSYILFLSFIIPCTLIGQVEICDNGIDDDNDSLIDLNDDDCDCVITEPKSLIANPSFEERNCCPYERSQLDCASNWIQASEPTTDFIHTCDWLGWDDFPPPQPFPDGEGIMGFRDGRVRGNNNPEPYWKEYAGACLLSPLEKDSFYRIQFDVGFVSPEKSPPIDISFFGTTSTVGGNLTIMNSSFSRCGGKEKNSTLLNTYGIINVELSNNTFKNNNVRRVATL